MNNNLITKIVLKSFSFMTCAAHYYDARNDVNYVVLRCAEKNYDVHIHDVLQKIFDKYFNKTMIEYDIIKSKKFN
jgi:hypothetical protein